MFKKPPEQSLAFVNDPQSLHTMIFALAVILLAVLMRDGVTAALRHYDRWLSPKGRFTRVNYKTARHGFRKSPVLAAVANLSDPITQIETIALVGFQTTPMLNREEARLLPILEAAVQEFAPRHRLMAQISLGELIRPRTFLSRLPRLSPSPRSHLPVSQPPVSPPPQPCA